MKRSLGIVIGSALLLSGCSLGQNTNTTESLEPESTAVQVENRGTSKCTVTNLSTSVTMSYVVSGKKMKVMNMDAGGGKKANMINDGIYIYSWNEGDLAGSKIKVQSDEEMKAKAGQTQYDDYNTDTFKDETKYKSDCSNTSVDESEFIPPTNINFIDPTEMRNMSPDQLKKLIPTQD